jgi:hypothetical protein
LNACEIAKSEREAGVEVSDLVDKEKANG